MADVRTDRQRRALVALWAIPGVGPKAVQALREATSGDLSTLLEAPASAWMGLIRLPQAVRRRLSEVAGLEAVADTILGRARKAGMGIAFPGDAAFPERLVGLEDAPPLLFHLGTPGVPRRRLAMVGSRHPDTGFLPFARRFAREVADLGLGIVSGAAEGVDRACHWGALDAGMETWAFLGSALDELDPAQARLLPYFLEKGGVFYSELPPGVRASTRTFPRRNRLISGASDAVLILRAGERSGSLHTALAALGQGRPLLALPGEVGNEAAAGCNALIRSGRASLCLAAEDACRAVGISPRLLMKTAQPERAASVEGLSAEARVAYAALDRRPKGFDEVLAGCRLPSGALTSALCELELWGLVIQHPGKLYEKV
ncbi:MAG TPA: DNA-processing protein DprA [Myxococcaceae bacterium]|nr:DNA-processing protein DprA [Myxococcaceae bacterium]